MPVTSKNLAGSDPKISRPEGVIHRESARPRRGGRCLLLSARDQPAARAIHGIPLTNTFNVDGAQVSRLEDFRLLTGRGKFASDWNLPGQLHGSFLRSNRAHARIVAIDITAARKHPGVRLVLTGEDAVKAGCVRPLNFMTFPGRNGMRAVIPERPALAHER